MSKTDLDGAYALATDEDTKKLYASWAESYDVTFAKKMDYVSPTRVAEAYVALKAAGPVMDFGAGTGLLGAELRRLNFDYEIDAIDLSREMLDVAKDKNIYRALYTDNLLEGARLPFKYAGVVSAGTFTLGHVGPNALEFLLDACLPGAHFALSINKQHFHECGFQERFDALSDRIGDLRLPEFALYGPNAAGEHKNDLGYLAQFRKT